jgi:hypothetical protein
VQYALCAICTRVAGSWVLRVVYRISCFMRVDELVFHSCVYNQIFASLYDIHFDVFNAYMKIR